ncbi:hypothetical protein C8Q80DRAFT_1198411 [Daedaleopsis nitida]|nr:hypothetical protein C8Q80DRAFT_1198411 [Daedaleopsis nitida]
MLSGHDRRKSVPRRDPGFPNEITDVIIDYLHDDKASLLACALVCRAWLSSSRYHLFRTFKIGERRAGVVNRTGLNFLATTPDIASRVRALELTRHHLNLSDLDTIFGALPNMRSLWLSDLGISIDHDPHTTTAPRFHPLEELKIYSCNVVEYKYNLLFHFLGLFQSITRLELSVGIRILNDDMSLDAFPPAHLALLHLSAFHLPLPVVWKLIQNTRTRETLRVLWYDDNIIDWPSVEELGSIFLALGPSRSLRRVVFGPLNIFTPYFDNFPPDENAEDVGRWPALQLQCCEGLEEFSLRTRMILLVHVELFAHLPKSVRTIWITFIGMDHTVRDPGLDSQWAEFDAAFSDVAFSHISLILDMSRVKETLKPEQYAELKNRAVAGLPRIGAQGRLEFTDKLRAWWGNT